MFFTSENVSLSIVSVSTSDGEGKAKVSILKGEFTGGDSVKVIL
jgi:hypothetical protein